MIVVGVALMIGALIALGAVILDDLGHRRWQEREWAHVGNCATCMGREFVGAARLFATACIALERGCRLAVAAVEEFAAALGRLEPLTVRIMGHFWPPTDEHLRGCVQCQEEMHKRRIEWEVGERTS